MGKPDENPEAQLGSNLGGEDQPEQEQQDQEQEKEEGAKLSPAQVKALDCDNDGKAGGAPPGGNRRAAAAAKAAKGMPERVWIILEENDDIPPTGLFVSHNGKPFLIRAGEPVQVPQFILGILDDAIMTVAVTDPTSRRVIGHRERMRYSYRRVAAPSSAE